MLNVFLVHYLSPSSSVLTLAGVGVASLGWPPGQVIAEIITLFTVQTPSVMVAHTPAVNLKGKSVWGGEVIYMR